jgi:phosphoadenosine phosphosulfate reductase
MTQMPQSLLPELRHVEEPLSEISARLEKASAEDRVRWALERFRPEIMLSTSFGAQSAVSLHMVTQQWPEVPVVMIDTGYLFPETYRFADQLTERLKLNLKVYRPDTSAAWLEARHGKLWEHGVEGIERSVNSAYAVGLQGCAANRLNPARNWASWGSKTASSKSNRSSTGRTKWFSST